MAVRATPDSVVAVTAFIGRARELRLIEDVMAAPARPTAVLLVGEAGSGKSRLLAEARRLVQQSTVLPVTGFEAEREVPLAAAGALLRALARIPDSGEALEGLLDARARGRRGSHHARDALEPLWIFEAAHRALDGLENAVLIIDDLQWVDELSRALCHYLVRGAVEGQQPLVVLAASRPGLDPESVLEGLPADAIRSVTLGPLDPTEGVALVRALDPTIDEAAATTLYTRAQGVPFWIEALARYERTPGGLQQLLTRRLRGAGAEAATVLCALALAGRPMSLAEVADVLDLPPKRVTAAASALSERGLVTTEGNIAQPAHDLVRMTAAAQVPEDLRTRVHAGLADLLARPPGADLQRLTLALEHRRAAGLPLVALAHRIASAAGRRLLGADGVGALGAIADAADPLAPETIDLHTAVAALSHELGHHEAALGRWSLVAARAADPLARARAALEASRAAYALDRADEARELLAQSRAFDRPDAVLALEQATHDAAIALWLERRGSEARRLAAHAVSMARRLRADAGTRHVAPTVLRAILGALRIQFEAAMQEGDPQALLVAAEERERHARGAGLEAALEAELALAVALRQNGRVPQALARFRRVWDDARRGVLPQLSVDAGFWLGRTLMLTGALEEAEAIVDETLDLVGRVGDVPRARHRVARVAAAVWFERGRPQEALAVLEHELGTAANQHQRIVLHADRAVWASRLESAVPTAIVAANLEAADACAAAVECPRCTAELLVLATEAQARIGDFDAAKQALRRRLETPTPQDELDRVTLGHAEALAVSRADARREALQAAVGAAGATPYRLPALWTRLDLGRAHAALGDGRAVQELEQVVAVAEEIGATTVRELAVRALRSLGIRTWRRAAGGAVLTPREEEVAGLVAAGVTNREVAARLFLSTKTVERHLVNIFRKLDVRNRTELAARLANTGAKRTGFPR